MNDGDKAQTAVSPVGRLARFSVTTQDTERLVSFWIAAFGCHELYRTPRLGEQPGCARLTLGASVIDFLEFEHPGRPYSPHLAPFDNEFQHFAIVVSDMANAYARLRATVGWTAISPAGPQKLPATAGGVTAFKFRDPDGHPLELLAFPPESLPTAWRSVAGSPLCLGIDHSALSVADVTRSVMFYRELGLRVCAQSFNHGIEQQLLDGVENPQVDVIGLAPTQSTPHVELLFYRNAARRRHTDIQPNDMFASRLIFERDAGAPAPLVSRLQIDPDGHYLEVVSP